MKRFTDRRLCVTLDHYSCDDLVTQSIVRRMINIIVHLMMFFIICVLDCMRNFTINCLNEHPRASPSFLPSFLHVTWFWFSFPRMTDWKMSMYRVSFHRVFSHLVFRFASIISFCPLYTPGTLLPGRDGHDECLCLDTELYRIHYILYKWCMSLFGHWTIHNALYTLQMMHVTVWTLYYTLLNRIQCTLGIYLYYR